jgi:hypothetical protein
MGAYPGHYGNANCNERVIFLRYMYTSKQHLHLYVALNTADMVKHVKHVSYGFCTRQTRLIILRKNIKCVAAHMLSMHNSGQAVNTRSTGSGFTCIHTVLYVCGGDHFSEDRVELNFLTTCR